MKSNREIQRDKLCNIRIGDAVAFTWKSGEHRQVCHGTVAGWTTNRDDHRHMLLVDDGHSAHERAVPLASVVSRTRLVGLDKGVIKWQDEPGSGKMAS